jgi:hypothetical protein
LKTGTTEGWFLATQTIVEERIRQAQKDGLFDDLPGKGKPLKIDDDSHIAPSLRASYRILKNAGILPPEMQLRKEISSLRQMILQVQDEGEARELVREINVKILESNILGGCPVSGGMDQIYVEKVLDRVRSGKGRLFLDRKIKGGTSSFDV